MMGIYLKSTRGKSLGLYFFSFSCETRLASSVSLCMRSTVYDVLTVMPLSWGKGGDVCDRAILDSPLLDVGLLGFREFAFALMSLSSLPLP
jgi:hypothetical protein